METRELPRLLLKPELLSPAGNMECLRAAIANGADAVYFGLQQFNARMRAGNFSTEDLSGIMEFLHERGVKGYATLNTLVFTDELRDAEACLLSLAEAGVDAVIVQDVGLARLAATVAPQLALHASTQMTITSPEGLAWAARLGLCRAVVARELSLDDLRAWDGKTCIPLEVFVHGALCVAYSGQCLTSESLGQRSANRGECAQACRLPYDLVVDGKTLDLGGRRHLLSPQDLAALPLVPSLIRLGVSAFKIEGRLKSPEYVAAVTAVYRKTIDIEWERIGKENPQQQAPRKTEKCVVSSDDRYTLEMAFSRGLDTGWLEGTNHQKLVHARFGKKRGAFVGFVQKVTQHFVEVEVECALKPGDGLVFDTGGDTEKEQGGRLFDRQGNRLFFMRGRIQFSKIKLGDRVWKTDDPALDKQWRKSFSGEIPATKQPASFFVTGRPGESLRVTVTTPFASVEVSSALPLQQAIHRPLTEKVFRAHWERLGGTPFFLESVILDLKEPVMLPMSEMNRLRREAVDRLLQKAPIKSPCKKPVESFAELMPRRDAVAPALSKPPFSMISALCRTLEQTDAAIEAGVERIYLDFEDARRFRDAVACVRASGITCQVLIATPRVIKKGEEGVLKLISDCKPDGVLIRNWSALEFFNAAGEGFSKIGDFTLNVANPISAAWFINAGLERVTAAYDLNAKQVLDLLQSTPPEWVEITLHQHMPMFHMEHCLFAAFISGGHDFRDCGRPCDRHKLKLRDRKGVEHPTHADVGCRNTVFHAKAQTGAAFLQGFMKAGARHFRLEFLDEDGMQTRSVIQSYRELLEGQLDANGLSSRLKAVSQLGVTSGTLTVL